MPDERMMFVQKSGKGKRRQRAYWKRVPVTAEEPTPAQARHRLLFSLSNIKTRGIKGVVPTRDGRKIPAATAAMADLVKSNPSIETLLPQPPTPPSPPPRRLTLEERLWLRATPEEKEQILKMRMLTAALGY